MYMGHFIFMNETLTEMLLVKEGEPKTATILTLKNQLRQKTVEQIRPVQFMEH